MTKLTIKEEEIMQALWKLEKAFVKDIKANLPRELHYNTVSTVVRKLEARGFIGHEEFGTTYRYFPLVSRKEYTSFIMNSTTHRFFNDSYKSMVSFFAKEEKISQEELEEILKLFKNKKK